MQDLNFNIFNLIIFSGIIQGVIFCSVIFFNKTYFSRTNIYIALTVLVLSLSNLQYWFLDVGFSGILSIFERIRVPCDTLIVPFFFLYVNSFLNRKNSNKIVILLLIPFVISLITNIFLFNNAYSTDKVFRNINIALENFSFLFNLILIVLILTRIKLYDKMNKNYNKHNIPVETKWLKTILYIGCGMCIFWYIEIIYMQTKYNNGGLSIYYPLWISISFLIYWISYAGISKSKIRNQRMLIRNSIIDNQKVLTTLKNKGLNKAEAHIKENKSFLNPKLSLKILSKELDLSEGYVSQLINKHSEYNFNDYINKLRVEESKLLLANPNYDNYAIESIGLECGFNSKSSFYSAFKKFTGKTPAFYKKEVRNL